MFKNHRIQTHYNLVQNVKPLIPIITLFINYPAKYNKYYSEYLYTVSIHESVQQNPIYKIFLTIPFFNYHLQAKFSTNKYQKHKYISKLNIMN